MFTGIINHLGIFKGYRQGKQEIAIEALSISSPLDLGESISINGACLSLIKKEEHTLFFNLSEETLKKTTLGKLKPGQKLNMELPLTLSSLTSGHLLTGHIDSTGKVTRIIPRKPGKRFIFSFPHEIKDFLVQKGSVAVNGVSLTIALLSSSYFEVELIPITLKKSNFGELKRGDEVNIECDIIGKYLYNWISKNKK